MQVCLFANFYSFHHWNAEILGEKAKKILESIEGNSSTISGLIPVEFSDVENFSNGAKLAEILKKSKFCGGEKLLRQICKSSRWKIKEKNGEILEEIPRLFEEVLQLKTKLALVKLYSSFLDENSPTDWILTEISVFTEVRADFRAKKCGIEVLANLKILKNLRKNAQILMIFYRLLTDEDAEIREETNKILHEFFGFENESNFHINLSLDFLLSEGLSDCLNGQIRNEFAFLLLKNLHGIAAEAFEAVTFHAENLVFEKSECLPAADFFFHLTQISFHFDSNFNLELPNFRDCNFNFEFVQKNSDIPDENFVSFWLQIPRKNPLVISDLDWKQKFADLKTKCAEKLKDCVIYRQELKPEVEDIRIICEKIWKAVDGIIANLKL